jgi:hypothetical protein
MILNSKGQENDNYSNPLNITIKQKIREEYVLIPPSMPIKDKSHLHILVMATFALQLYLLHILFFFFFSNFDLGIGVSLPAHHRSFCSAPRH